MAPPSKIRGFAVLVTGLPAAGKTTLGTALTAHIETRFGRPVTLLDGDEVRKLLSSELGYSREHRRLNVLRHGYIAAQVCRHGGIAICALIAPYAADRSDMRELVAPCGSFVEIYLSTPLEVCEQRDPKGLYARARAGQLKNMTGVDDPYEPPESPDLRLNGAELSVQQMVRSVIGYLVKQGLLREGR
ncbi:MAG: adenylyl-sulfate kinase [Betaproteobacteria bacterium]|nr:adenylyl-sulfate kinase [Betaproteobacteria bacterium]